MTVQILFEDDHLAIVSKPPGLVVNQAETVAEDTLQGWWQDHLTAERQIEWKSMIPADFDTTYGSPADIFAERGGIVHRLDKDTSGVMVLAKHPAALIALLSQFKQRQTEKKYLALVHGTFQVPEAIISEPLGRASRDRKVFAVRADGREAVTKYRVAQVYKTLDIFAIAPTVDIKLSELQRRFRIYEGFSMVECWPKTGRTHQIRVHLAHLRHPIVGDVTYLGRKRQQLDPLWCSRQFLHASELSLNHPVSGERLTFAAELPPDLQQSLELLS